MRISFCDIIETACQLGRYEAREDVRKIRSHR